MNKVFWGIIFIIIGIELIQRAILKNRKVAIKIMSAFIFLYIGGYILHYFSFDGSKPRYSFNEALRRSYHNTVASIQTIYSTSSKAVHTGKKEMIG